MHKIKALANSFLNDEDGATMIEYGLLAALIALVVAAAAFTLGGSLGNRFNEVDNCVQAAGKTSAPCS
ncbi:MAG: Flp family type IVb pilin [Gemmatimonadaceae bacterium]